MSPLTSGRLSHSSEPLNGVGSLTGTDSPPVSPSEEFDDVVKVFHFFLSSTILCILYSFQNNTVFHIIVVFSVSNKETNISAFYCLSLSATHNCCYFGFVLPFTFSFLFFSLKKEY